MFEEWYPHDEGKITATTNHIGPIKRVLEKYCSKLYDCLHAAAVMVELLRRQETGAFTEWYNTTGLLHEKLKRGTEERFMLRPPILLGIRKFCNLTKEHVELIVRECGDQGVPMLELRQDG